MQHLEEAMHATHNLVLACQLLPDGSAWEDPLARFRAQAAALGHVHAEPDELDSVGRSLPLEKAANRDRRWALSLEAFRLSRGGAPIVESPDDLRGGRPCDPVTRAGGRLMRIRYVPPSMEYSARFAEGAARRSVESPRLLRQGGFRWQSPRRPRPRTGCSRRTRRACPWSAWRSTPTRSKPSRKAYS